MDSDAGGVYLRRLHSISKYLLIVAILISLLGLVMFLPGIKMIRSWMNNDMSAGVPVHVIVSVIYTFVFIVFFPLQVFYYYKFSQTGRRSYLETDKNEFNKSLRFLVSNAWICCITYTLNLLYFLFLVYAEW
jgi:uncharacterized membrane protein